LAETGGKEADADEIAKRDRRIAELTAALNKAREQGGGDRSEHMAAIMQHLRRRHARLVRMRQLLREKSQIGGSLSEELHHDELVRIEQEKIQLNQVRKMLENSERRMMKRWARTKATTAAAAIVLMAVVCAFASWLTAGRMAPAKRSVFVTLEARATGNSPLTDDQARLWTDWHAELVRSAAFHQSTAKRMTENRLDNYSRPDELSRRMRGELTLDANTPGTLVMTMAGENVDEITAVLDVITAAVLAESAKQASKRKDNAATAVLYERQEGGRMRYAQLNAVPISDNRLNYALPIFACMFAVCVIMIVLGYLQFMKLKRVFDQDNAQLFDRDDMTRPI
jgi:hypothetical protein